MKKTTKGFILGMTTAAAAFGAYYAIKNKDKLFKKEEIINENGETEKVRSYVDLDNIKEKTNEAVTKTKEAAQDTWGKAKDKFESFKKSLKKEDVDVINPEEVEVPAEDVVLSEEEVDVIAPEDTTV